jgi:signal transduction histidine kinase
MFKTLRGRVIATCFIVVIISLVLASVFFLFFLSRYTRTREKRELLREVTAIARDVKQLETGTAAQNLPPKTQAQQSKPVRGVVVTMLNAESDVLKAKLMLVAPDGTVLVQSKGAPSLGTTLQLPQGVLSSGPLITEHYFQKLARNYLFATAPTQLGSSQGYLMALKPVEQVGAVAGSLIGYVIIAGLIALALSMLLALYLSGALSRPIREVTAAARLIAAGDYTVEVPVRGSDETAELARDFNEMALRVRNAYELQRNFVGNVSHELRTPLTSIEGFSQALLDGVSDSEEERRRSLEIINQESKRLVRVLRDLLLLSQIDAGELRPEKKQVDVVDLMRKLGSIYELRAESQGLDFGVQPPPGAQTAFTDPDRLERVLTNLLDNAFKYTGEAGTVRLTAASDGHSIAISVKDSGPGIPPELLPNIFDRFYRVEQSRAQKHGGSGLGLSICKELVWTLGGTIKVQSRLGHGTTFTVTLPIS